MYCLILAGLLANGSFYVRVVNVEQTRPPMAVSARLDGLIHGHGLSRLCPVRACRVLKPRAVHSRHELQRYSPSATKDEIGQCADNLG